MANNYQQGSSLLEIPPDKLEAAATIVAKALETLESDSEINWEPIGCTVEMGEGEVWFYEENWFNPESVEYIARRLVEQLGIDEPFYCSWAYTCDKPRTDEFGGGAFVLKRGYQTYWCDATQQTRLAVQNDKLEPRCPIAPDDPVRGE